MERLLFVRAGALGDLVVTLPILDALRAGGRVVDVACAPRFAPLLARSGLVEAAPGEVLDVGGVGMAWAFGGEAPRAWAGAVAFSRAWGEGLAAAGVPSVRWVEAIPRGPATAWFARVLDGAAVGLPTLRPGPVGSALVSDPEAAPVVLAPGAGGAAKRTSLAWWAALSDALVGRGVPVAWVGGPGEAGEAWPARGLSASGGGEVSAAHVLAAAADARGAGRGAAVRAQLGLDATIDLAAACRAWIGPDSGPTHVAAAAMRGAGRDPGATLAVFGPTDPGVWAPPGATVARLDVAVPDVLDFVFGAARGGVVGRAPRG